MLVALDVRRSAAFRPDASAADGHSGDVLASFFGLRFLVLRFLPCLAWPVLAWPALSGIRFCHSFFWPAFVWPEFSARVENASAAVLSSAREPAQALRFARYLAAPEKGGAIFQANGFTPAGGDKWALAPEMILYSGGVNRLAVEKLLRAFSDREGVTVTTIFNGCGVV